MNRRFRVIHPYECYWFPAHPVLIPVGTVGEKCDDGRYYAFPLGDGRITYVFRWFVETFTAFFEEIKA